MANIRFNILDKLNKFGFNDTDFEDFARGTGSSPVDNPNSPIMNLQLHEANRRVGGTGPKEKTKAEDLVEEEKEEDELEGAQVEVEEDLGVPYYSKTDKSQEASAERLERGEGRGFDKWRAMSRGEKIGAALTAFSEFAAVASSQDPAKALTEMMQRRQMAEERKLEREMRQTERQEMFAFQRGMQESTQKFTEEQAVQQREWSTEDRDIDQSWKEFQFSKNREYQLEDKDADQLFTLTRDATSREFQKELLGIENQLSYGRMNHQQKLNLESRREEIAMTQGMQHYNALIGAGVDPLKAAGVQSFLTDSIKNGGEMPFVPDQETRLLLDQSSQLIKLEKDFQDVEQAVGIVGSYTNAIMTDPMATPNKDGIQMLENLSSLRRSGGQVAGHGEDTGPGGLWEGIVAGDTKEITSEEEWERSKTTMADHVRTGTIPSQATIDNFLLTSKGRADDDAVRETLTAADIPMAQVMNMVPETETERQPTFLTGGEAGNAKIIKRRHQKTYVDPLTDQLPSEYRAPFRNGTDPLHKLSVEEQQKYAHRLKAAWQSGRGNNRLALEKEMERIRLEVGEAPYIPRLMVQ